ncbi:hypothetical protein VMCG_03482 [Cytospora schulzeri]|uniref:Uncharacterized protein n=1 Tax=Cytospora schulzeri TaxID=448051 RepID=A0A423WWL9_9PEZI|nr:hypothetical protein VMCG_03482 [Valsa malicola]
MAGTTSEAMEEFLRLNPTADANEARACHGPAQEPAQMQEVSVTGPKGIVLAQRCSKCPQRILTELKRHNTEVHKKDPSLAFFCPVPSCTKFLHTTKDTVLKKLTASTLRHLAEEDRAKVSAVEVRKADLLAKLPTDLPQRLTIEGLTVPGGLVDHQKPDLGTMNNEALIMHVICLRQTIQEWEEAFTKAEPFLASVGHN